MSCRSKTTNTQKLTSIEQYKAEKKAVKERRTELYNYKVARQAGLRTRQDPEKKNYKKTVFRTWFDAMAAKQAYLDREARRQGKEWNINVAAMVERLPVVTPDKHQWELDFLNLKAELQRYDMIAYPKELGLPDPMDIQILSEEELMKLLPEGFTPAPRETEADKNGVIQTLNRRLKTRVYLSIRKNDHQGWQLPTVSLTENETFLEGAKRAVKMVAGEDLVLRCFTNCPMGVHVAEYSAEAKEKNSGFFGEKTFFLRVQYENGDVNTENMEKMKMNDWGWLTRDEMV
eukprot:CAMPEP_0176492762 /NCGR_PEP_ID=MMETSP0200_2-20121128/9185_1 /TAXON_ID=947934 /ORGANISM="Chaetoceros sp., Strain GSL56" /LENGTH=287 /DNA_ID=CAMNT_0017890373 /DNA_START=151 /DNA_END=1010 /DNA_ORIENTATION=-